MVLTTGNLIVLGISVVLIFVLRRFDRARIQLSRIKKYADKIIKEYQDISVATIREFQDNLINLDINLKRAKHISQTVETNLGGIETHLQTIRDEEGNLKALEERLHKTLNRLQESARMAGELEQREAGLKRTVSKVDYIQSALAETEKKIPVMEKQFRQRVEDRIQNFMNEFSDKRMQEIEKNLAGRIQDADTLLAGKVQEIEAKLRTAQEDSAEMQKEIGNALIDARNRIEEELDSLYTAMKEQADAGQERLLREVESMETRQKAQSRGMEDNLEQFRSTLAEEKHALNKEVAAIDSKIKSFVKESRVFSRADGLMEELNSGISELNLRIDKLKNEKEGVEELNRSLSRISTEKEAVQGMIETLSRDKDSLCVLESRLETVEATVSGFESRVTHQQQELDSELETKRQELKQEIIAFQNELSEVRKKGTRDTREEISLFNNQFKEIDRRVKDFVKQTKLFDKADQLAGKLNGEINELNNRISELKNEKKDLLTIRKEVAAIRQEEDEIKTILTQIGKEKIELDGLEHRLGVMTGTATQLETRFDKIDKAGAILKPMEARIRDIEKLNQQLKGQMEDVNLKDAKLARALSRFNKADSYVDTLEKKIEAIRTTFSDIDQEKKTITREMEQLSKKTRRIEEDRTRVTTLLSRFDHMEGMMKDVERRISQVTLAQDKIGTLETRMRDLSSQAEVRIEDLSELSTKMDSFFGVKTARSGSARRTKDAAGEKARSSDDKRLNEKIFKMFDSGIEIARIAEIVKRPVADIQLRLHVRKE